MKTLFQTVDNLESAQSTLRERAYGMIEVTQGRLLRIQFKPWPKIASRVEAKWISGWRSSRGPHDVCRLYYNQPWQHRNYLALAYLESTLNTRAASVFKALDILDQIACLKKSDAILAELTNFRISDRLMERLGWSRHLQHRPQRHWIKRFYGDYEGIQISAPIASETRQ